MNNANVSVAMSKNNQWLIDAIKGEAASHTSIAFETGAICERQQIINIIKNNRDLSPTQLIRLIKEQPYV